MRTVVPRRLVRSFAVFAAAFVAIGGAVGFATASQDDGESTFAVAAPRPGDTASYDVTVEEVGRTEADYPYVLRAFQARWMPEADAMDEDGVARPARVLATRLDIAIQMMDGSERMQSTYQDATYDAATGRPFMVTSFIPYESASPQPVPGLPGGVPALSGGASAGSWWRYDDYNHWLGPCGFRTSLQAGPQDLASPVAVGGRCDEGNETAEFLFRDAGPDLVGGIPARRFVALHDPDVQVWYHESLPVPVRLRTHFKEYPIEMDFLAGRILDLRLTGFERGAVSYPPAAPPQAGAVHRVETAPRQPWGPADAGLVHPFPLQEAYGIAIADQGVPFGRYLRDTPGSYLASAWHWKWTDEYGHLHRGWWMLATDGQSYESAGVGRHPVSAGPLTLPPEAGSVDSVYRWRDPDVIPDDVTGIYPPAGLAPARLPTVTSTFARYEELRDPALSSFDAEMYGFATVCADLHCRGTFGFTAAGIAEGQYDWGGIVPSPTRALEGERQVWTMLSVDEDGRVRNHYRETAESPPFMGLLGFAPAGLPADAQSSGSREAARVWMAPSAPAAAGVGLAAVAAAILYYAVAAKGLPFVGLFTRIGTDQILEHPARRRLHDAIQAEPGIHFQELARRLGMGHGVLDHHVQKLLVAGLIVKRQAPRYTCFFPKGAVDRRLMDAAPILRSRGGRQVLEAIAAEPGATHRAVAARAGLSPSTVSYHVRRLREAGLVNETPVPGASSLQLTGMGQQAIGPAVAA